MKKPLFLSSFLLILLIASCSKSSKTEISGSVTSKYLEGKTVYLYSMLLDSIETKGPILKDSAVVKDGKFVFNISLDFDPSLGLISFNKDNADATSAVRAPQTFVVLEKGNVSLSLDSNKVVLGGTLRNEALNDVHYTVNNQLLDINDEIVKAGNVALVPLDKNGKNIQERMRDISKETRKKMYNFLKDNMNNKVGELLFWDMAQDLSSRQKLDLIALADTSFQNRRVVLDTKQYLNDQLERENKVVGSHYKDASLVNIKGQAENLSKYLGKGKYVILFFWNTQSPICIQQMAYLTTVYDTYREKGLEIVGVSLEQDRKRFDDVMLQLSTVDELKGAAWIQLYDATHTTISTYEISEVPYILLIDKEGKIIGVDLSPFEMEEKLEEVLN